MIAIIDARKCEQEFTDFLTLGLWGKPTIEYVIDTALSVKAFQKIKLITENLYLKKLIEGKYGEVISIAETIDDGSIAFFINGRCPLIKKDTIEKAIEISRLKGKCASRGRVTSRRGWNTTEDTILPVFFFGNLSQYSTCSYSESVFISEEEQVIVNSKNSFELALTLINKWNKANWLSRQIEARIEEKRSVLSQQQDNTICLVGHSQFDQWLIDNICGYKVQNCGISGISSLEYHNLILKKGFLRTRAKYIVMLHGTNDIVYENNINQIVSCIQQNIIYIQEQYPEIPILFVECLHVNGRLDRSNQVIDSLNSCFQKRLKGVHLIKTSEFDDDYGNLKSEYTEDGLHLSALGYTIFYRLLSMEITKYEEISNYSC